MRRDAANTAANPSVMMAKHGAARWLGLQTGTPSLRPEGSWQHAEEEGRPYLALATAGQAIGFQRSHSRRLRNYRHPGLSNNTQHQHLSVCSSGSYCPC